MKHPAMLLCTCYAGPRNHIQGHNLHGGGSNPEWFKTEGEVVREEEVLFEMETDKAVVEVGAPSAGVLLRVMASEGSVKVGTVVGWIGQPGDPIEETTSAHPPLEKSAKSQPVRSVVESQPTRILATPAARRRAAELEIPLETVQSATPGARLTQEDVEKAAAVYAEPDKKSPGQIR